LLIDYSRRKVEIGNGASRRRKPKNAQCHDHKKGGEANTTQKTKIAQHEPH